MNSSASDLGARIDREALVRRHNPVLRRFEPLSPLAVGNGDFAFTADLTGLQSFPEQYTIPLGTQSGWGWHSTGRADLYQLDDLRPAMLETYGRKVGYPILEKGQEKPFHWLRQNPHRLQLGQIGFRFLLADGGVAEAGHIQAAEQTLDLWRGLLVSRFEVEGCPVRVETCVHPERDVLGVSVETPLLGEGRLEITLRFPAPDPGERSWARTIGLRWDQDDRHDTRVQEQTDEGAVFVRSMDEDGYSVRLSWQGGRLSQEGKHEFAIRPRAEEGAWSFTAGFAPNSPLNLPDFRSVRADAERHWEQFWQTGGAVELAGSRDPRAFELERRIVLSQFLTAIHCAGSLPPQETGLLYSSWFGKAHLEMHWWHAAHFPLWGRTALLEKSMDWYLRILPEARNLARSQGYTGARWPKMVGPEGRQSPSPIGALLIWQQPHPLVLAELIYKASPTRETLEKYRDMVMETAEFMASFAEWDESGQRYVLGPPVIPAQEEFKGPQTMNPTFELEYWRHGLDLALAWRARLGLDPVPRWVKVRDGLADLPQHEGVYIAHEWCPETFRDYNTDHPSMLGALGILPGKKADPDVMRKTLRRAVDTWQWETSWGWDFPMAAMTAARLGEGSLAVDFLLMETTKNTYLPNGHNYQRPDLMAYLPGNGGLLTAVAMMACGWDGFPSDAPGFPSDGSWEVRHEGLNAWL
jgi:hypothetical protein